MVSKHIGVQVGEISLRHMECYAIFCDKLLVLPVTVIILMEYNFG